MPPPPNHVQSQWAPPAGYFLAPASKEEDLGAILALVN